MCGRTNFAGGLSDSPDCPNVVFGFWSGLVTGTTTLTGLSLTMCTHSSGRGGGLSGFSTTQIIIDWHDQINQNFLARSRDHQVEVDLAINLGWGDIPFGQLPDDWRTRSRYDPRIRVRF